MDTNTTFLTYYLAGNIAQRLDSKASKSGSLLSIVCAECSSNISRVGTFGARATVITLPKAPLEKARTSYNKHLRQAACVCLMASQVGKRHSIGCHQSPVKTLPYLLLHRSGSLWCGLGCCSQTVVLNYCLGTASHPRAWPQR